MSIWVDDSLECSACAEVYPIRTVDGLNLTRNPDIRDAITAGRFNKFTCPSCGAPTVLERQFIYTDLERRHFLLVRPRAQVSGWRNAEADIEDLFRFHLVEEPSGRLFDAEALARFQVRAVFGYEHLREKLLIWDAGLDDRVFEVAKMNALRLQPRLAEHGYEIMVVDELTADGFTLLLARQRGADPVHIRCDLAAYHELAAGTEALRERFPELFTRAFVDLRRYFPR